MARHSDVPLAGLPDEGAVVLTLGVRDIGACAQVLAGVAVSKQQSGTLKVPPAHANGAIVVFSQV